MQAFLTTRRGIRDPSLDLANAPYTAVEYLSSNSPMTPSNQFLKEKELTASMNDLEQIFENSSSEEEKSPPPTLKEPAQVKKPSQDQSFTLDYRKMFPTPPSLESILAASPAFAHDASLMDYGPCSPELLEALKDFSFVYKPPQICNFPAPEKYKAVSDMPSVSKKLPAHLVYNKNDLMNAGKV